MRKNKFTLIELIIVIVIIAILTAIVLPNISGVKALSIKSAIKGNIRNIQTSSDMYSLDNQEHTATITKPILGKPSQMDYDKLYPKYLRKNCNKIIENYWLDHLGEVWGATITPPKVNEITEDDFLTWSAVSKAKSYNIYTYEKDKFKLVEKKVTSPYKVALTNKELFVSAVDEYGFETPPVNSSYDPTKDVKKCTYDSGNPLPEDPDDPDQRIGFKVGDYISMGQYNGQEIKWVVLKNDIIGSYLFNIETIKDLENIPYNASNLDKNVEGYYNTNWNESLLREVLNNEFIYEVFTEYQKSVIIETNYKYYTDNNPTYYSYGSEKLDIESGNQDVAYANYSRDKISLPSILDPIDTNILDYFDNLHLHTQQDDIAFFTKDTYGSVEDGFLTLYAYGFSNYNYETTLVYPEWYYSVRPVLYVDTYSDTISGDGSKENPYVIEKNKDHTQKGPVVLKYDDIVLGDGMFPSKNNSNYQLANSLNLNIPDKFIGKKMTLSFTLEKQNGEFRMEGDGFESPLWNTFNYNGLLKWSGLEPYQNLSGGVTGVFTGTMDFVYSGTDAINFYTKYRNGLRSSYVAFKDIQIKIWNCTPDEIDELTKIDHKNPTLKVGTHFVMGEYNSEPLHWVVLRNDLNGSYVFNTNTLNSLKNIPFNSLSPTNSIWAESTVKTFLNNDFYNNAFNTYQKSLIKNTNYKYYVGDNPEKSSVGTEYFYLYYMSNIYSNEKDAYANYANSKISLPSAADVYYHFSNINYNIDETTGSFITRDVSGVSDIIKINILDEWDRDLILPDLYLTNESTSPDELNSVRPVMYLNKSVKAISGDGTVTNPYIIE